MWPFPPIDLKKILIIAAVLVALTGVSVTVDRWWGAHKLADSTEIADLQRAKAVLALKVKGLDRELAVLKHRDTVHLAAIAKDSVQLKVASTQLASAKAAIDSDAVLHAGLVPIIAVHELEGKYEATIASCEHLNTDKDSRIDDLLKQISNQAAARVDLDISMAADATILKDTVAILKPPWPRRLIGWVDDHLVTGSIFTGLGTVIGIMIAKH